MLLGICWRQTSPAHERVKKNPTLQRFSRTLRFLFKNAGKSTLLRALAVGVYDKVPGDGRELAVTDPAAVTVRAEDGRPVSGVDISPFISSLPSSAAGTAPANTQGQSVDTTTNSANGDIGASGGRRDQDGGRGNGGSGGITTTRFSTTAASGSTSQAANVMEALEAGASALLLDEDTCAGNVRRAPLES